MMMNIMYDAEWQSGIGEVAVWLSKTGYFEDFQAYDYGPGLDYLAVYLICRNPEYNFKRRIQHSKKDKTIYMDIMLNLPEFVHATFEARRKKVLEVLLKEVPEVVGRYKVAGFDTQRFLSDFNEKFAALLAQLSPLPRTIEPVLTLVKSD